MATAALVTVLGAVMPGLSSHPLCSENYLLKHHGAKLLLLWKLSVFTFQVLQHSWECRDVRSRGTCV